MGGWGDGWVVGVMDGWLELWMGGWSDGWVVGVMGWWLE